MKAVAEFYTKGPTRVQFMDKDPAGWQEFYEHVLRAVGEGPRADHARRADVAAVGRTSSRRPWSA